MILANIINYKNHNLEMQKIQKKINVHYNIFNVVALKQTYLVTLHSSVIAS